MGWLWGTRKTEPPKNPDQDPLRDLDPSLIEFLEKESPQKYTPPAPAPSPPPPETAVPSDNVAAAPPPTLFPDGRYAHLWSNYKPQAQVEAESKTDQAKLMDLLDDYKIRRTNIGRAAMENCVIEQETLKACYDNGGWEQRLTMCRTENRAFDRCFQMQSRFLKALGYVSQAQTSTVIGEEVQMHADTLYHRMLSQEAAIEAAKAAGAPIPTFPPILPNLKSRLNPQSTSSSPPQPPPNQSSPKSQPPSSSSPPPPQNNAIDKDTDFLTPVARAALNARLAKLSPEQREIEEQIAEAEARQYEQFGRELSQLREDEGRNRQDRRDRGVATVGDTISGWFGW